MNARQDPSHAQVLHEVWMGTLCMIRQLPNGEWIGLHPFLTTLGLLVGLDGTGSYRTRFCYRSVRDAMEAALKWDGTGDPPGEWVKEKGKGVDRVNPKLTTLKGVAVVTELRRRESRT